MVVHAPWAVDVVVPHALKVCRHVACAGAGYKQIAAILEVLLFEFMVKGAVAVVAQTGGGGLIVKFPGRIDFYVHTVKQILVVRYMVCIQFVITLGRSCIDHIVDTCHRIDAYKGRGIGDVGIEVHHIVGVAGKYELHIVGAGHGDCTGIGIGFDGAAVVGADHYAHCPLHIVVVYSAVVEQAVVGSCNRTDDLRTVERQGKVLWSALRCVSPHHHAVRIGAEIAAAV